MRKFSPLITYFLLLQTIRCRKLAGDIPAVITVWFINAGTKTQRDS
jgi:hypothetical protein